jgi:hypothetical protein
VTKRPLLYLNYKIKSSTRSRKRNINKGGTDRNGSDDKSSNFKENILDIFSGIIVAIALYIAFFLFFFNGGYYG